MTDTDPRERWRSPEMARRLRKRHAAERRFRYWGVAAIASAAASVPMSGPKAATRARLTFGSASAANAENACWLVSTPSATLLLPLITPSSAVRTRSLRHESREISRNHSASHDCTAPTLPGRGVISSELAMLAAVPEA